MAGNELAIAQEQDLSKIARLIGVPIGWLMYQLEQITPLETADIYVALEALRSSETESKQWYAALLTFLSLSSDTHDIISTTNRYPKETVDRVRIIRRERIREIRKALIDSATDYESAFELYSQNKNSKAIGFDSLTRVLYFTQSFEQACRIIRLKGIPICHLQIVFIRCIELASTIDEINILMDWDDFDTEIKDLFLAKWNIVSAQPISTIHEAEQLAEHYNRCPPGSASQLATLRKLLEVEHTG